MYDERMRIAVMVVAVAGCGRIGFSSRTGPDGATGGDALDGDAIGGDAPAPCTTWGPFGAPQRMPAVLQSTSDDWGPAPSADELDLLFYSYRGSSADVYESRRASTAGAWSAPAAIASVNTANAEGDPTLTGDGLDMIYDQMVGGVLKIHVAHRTSVGQPFGAPVLLPGVDRAGDEAEPFISLDGLRLYYRAATAIVEATRPDRSSAFGPFTMLVSDTGGDNDPTVSSDGLEMIFSSKSRGGMGGADLFTTHRLSLGQAFGPVTPVVELESTHDDVGPKLSADGATLYFNYDTDTSGTMGLQADLYLATRSCL